MIGARCAWAEAVWGNLLAAPPLTWKRDEGTDVHLLRGGPESKRLIDTLNLDAEQADSVTFIPNILGSTSDCRYILVDTIDPAQHGRLDTLYPEVGA